MLCPRCEDAYPVASLCEQKKAVALFFVSHFLGVLRGCYGLQMSPCIAFGGSHSLVLSDRVPPSLPRPLSWVRRRGGVAAQKPHGVDTSAASKWGRSIHQCTVRALAANTNIHYYACKLCHEETGSFLKCLITPMHLYGFRLSPGCPSPLIRVPFHCLCKQTYKKIRAR